VIEPRNGDLRFLVTAINSYDNKGSTTGRVETPFVELEIGMPITIVSDPFVPDTPGTETSTIHQASRSLFCVAWMYKITSTDGRRQYC